MKDMDIGTNRTGMSASPAQAKQLLDAMKSGTQTPPGDETAIGSIRALYSKEAPMIGSVSPPAAPKGSPKATLELIHSERGVYFLDKIGERLGYERCCARMYDALIAKFRAGGSWSGGPAVQDLVSMRDDKLRFYETLRTVLIRYGADATSTTPAASLAFVCMSGIFQVIADPRTRPFQGLRAAFYAQVAEHEGWASLVELAAAFGQAEFADELRPILAQEQRYGSLVRAWLRSYEMGEGALELDEIRRQSTI